MQQSPARFIAYALILTLVGSIFSIALPAFESTYGSHENITVSVGGDPVTHTYEDDESVVIEVQIEDVVDNEEVIVSIGEPGSSPDEVDSDEPSSSGYFDYVYDVSGSPEEGVYTVEVEYDDEFAYTYFVVDVEDDTITVELDSDDGLYEDGDDVVITGQVEEVDIGEEDSVHISVLDSANNEIVDEDVELGDGTLDEDEFEFEFALDDADHGRYAVIVTYDVDDQEGSTLFEIEDTEDDDDNGSSGDGDSDSDGDLSAEIMEAEYEPGDTVTIEGEIDNYDEGDNIDLEILIEDDDGEEIDSDDSVSVDEDDGSFSYDYDLEDDAPEGTYAVTVTYDDLEVELEFDVEEGGSSGGSGGSSSDLTIRLSKTSFLAGESMTVSGAVEDVADPDDGEQLSVFIYRPTGQVILAPGSSKYVTPSSSGAYSATIAIPSNLEADEDYKVIVSYLGEQVEANFDITGKSSTPSDEIVVETDNDEYGIGSTVEISGSIPQNIIVQGQNALLLVNKPDGGPCRTDQLSIPSSGEFEYSMPLGGNCGVAGEYEVVITYRTAGGSSLEGQTTFELVGSSVAKYNLQVEGSVYPIDYEMSSGSINSMFVRPADKKLVININAEEDGQLTLKLPREVIEATQNGDDIDFVISVENESGNIDTIEPDEIETTSNARTIRIDYDAGTERIEILGTNVVPEFGAIAAILLAVAIIGIIVATTRYGKMNFRV